MESVLQSIVPGGIRLQEVARAFRFQWSLRWQRRRLLRTAALPAIPVALAIVVALLQQLSWVPVLGTDMLAQMLAVVFLQFLLVVVPLQFGTGLVAQEEEAGTLVFQLVQPVSRGSLLVGKLLGAWAASSLLLCAALGLSSAVLLGADGFAAAGDWVPRLVRCGLVLAVGALAYGILFTLVGLCFARPALVGLFLAFGWENAIAFLPGWIKSLTVRHHLAAFLTADALPGGMLRALDPPSAASGAAVLAVGSVLGLGVAAWAFARRDCG